MFRFIICFYFLFTSLFASSAYHPSFKEIEQILSSEKIVSQIPMEEFLSSKGHVAHFTSEVYLVEFADGVQAVLKLADPEWPRDAIAEVGAYRASEFLGIHLVPPTVLYNRNGVIGSLQYYVEPSFDLMDEVHYAEAIKKVSTVDLANKDLFYFIFGQWDPDPSNLIAVQKGDRVHFALIDNAAMGYTQKARYGDHPFVLCFPDVLFPEESVKDFPFDQIRLLPPDKEVWQKEYGAILSTQQIRQLCQLRWSPVAFVIWDQHLWRQYRFGSPSYTDFYPQDTMDKIRALTKEKLLEFFANDLGFVFSDDYYEQILDRKDQVLTAQD